MRASFRDPDGSVEDDGQRICRRIHPHAVEQTTELLDSPLLSELIRDGLIIGVQERRPLDDGGLLLEHRRVEIPSYAFEWTPAMLADAARLTLEIQQRAWAQGWTLKDAATSNVLFEGSRAIFCDLLSLQRRRPDDAPGWQAYGQFVRHFILPLVAVAELGRTPRDIFLSHRDGLHAAEIAPFVPWHAHFGLAMWLHVRLPARLEKRRIQHDPKKASGATKPAGADGTPWLLGSLKSFVARLEKHGRGLSTWSEYTGNRAHYEALELDAKRKAIEELSASGKYRRVLDIGANNGEFALIAARSGSQVLALDEDVNALHDLHIRARQGGLRIQCLHANYAQPTPATGWRLSETLSLQQRLAGRFDLVLMLAVIHHLTVTERLPTPQLFETLADCCHNTLLLEFVSREDPRFVEIAGANMKLYEHWDLPFVLDCAEPWFELQDSLQISEHRTLLRLHRRKADHEA